MGMLKGAKVLVADDDIAVRDILSTWLSLHEAEAVVVSDGLEAVQAVMRQHFDLVITDLHMPHLSGHQVLALIKAQSPDTEVIFLSGQGTMEDAIIALRENQAFDFLLKPMRDFGQLNTVLRRALTKRAAPSTAEAPVAPPDHVEALSEREREIMALVAEGLDNRAIADRLVLSVKTVRNHLSRIYDKLHVGNRTKAVMDCRAYGMIS